MNKRFLLILLAAAFLYGNAAAQETAFPVNCTDGSFKVQYAVDKESSVLLLCRYIPNAVTEGPAPYTKNVNRKIHVSTPDGDYALLNTCQIPVMNEADAKFAYLKGEQPALNFSLEFEKFPIDEKFDIVDESSETEGLNFRGVSVDASSSKSVDAKRFMSSTQLCRYGKFYDNGNCISYYDRDGVVVAANASYGDDHFTLYLSLVNNSDHGILFNTKNLTVKGHKPKGRDSVEVNLYVYSKNDYVDLVAAEDRYEAQKQVQSNGMREVESAVSFATIGTPIRSAERTGLTILSGVLKDINYNRVKPHLAELDKTREERTKDYLLSQSIDAGESHSGFLRISRPKKVNDCMVTLHVDGYDFTFDYDIK